MSDDEFLPEAAINDRRVDDVIKAQLIVDTIDTGLLGDIDTKASSRTCQVARTYRDNQSLWSDLLAGKVGHGKSLRLENCRLLEWLPSCPGRYFTPEAEEARKMAQRYVRWKKKDGGKEYLPLGKSEMVLGGVGSVRLAPRNVRGREVCFLGASFNGVSHQGIPVVVPLEKGQELLERIAAHGSCYGSVIGTLWPLPVDQSPIKFDRGIPKYYVFAKEIGLTYSPKPDKALVTVAITYSSTYEGSPIPLGDLRIKWGKNWCFASFDPSNGQDGLKSRVEWMKQYVLRYTRPNDKLAPIYIVGDFDEIYQHFEQPVEFPLSTTMRGEFDPRLLYFYSNLLNSNLLRFEINYNFIFKGDIFNNIQNSSIVSKSDLDHAIVMVQNLSGESVSAELSAAAAAVGQSQDPAAVALLQGIVDEMKNIKSDNIDYIYGHKLGLWVRLLCNMVLWQ